MPRLQSALTFWSSESHLRGAGFILPALRKGGEQQPGEGAGKKHLITGVSLLVTRRWQRLPWVSRFRERRVFCLEARGLLRSLPWLGGQPGLTEPLSTPASAVRQASCPSAGPGGGEGSLLHGLRELKVKARGSGHIQRRLGSRTPPPPHAHTPSLGRGTQGDKLWPIQDVPA